MCLFFGVFSIYFSSNALSWFELHLIVGAMLHLLKICFIVFPMLRFLFFRRRVSFKTVVLVSSKTVSLVVNLMRWRLDKYSTHGCFELFLLRFIHQKGVFLVNLLVRFRQLLHFEIKIVLEQR